MANGNGFIITKDTWENMPQEQREWLLFDTMQDMNTRLKAVEKRPLTDKCFSFLGGVVGGALAYLGIKWGA
jgi:surfactin synthase thioesterase subunit